MDDHQLCLLRWLSYLFSLGYIQLQFVIHDENNSWILLTHEDTLYLWFSQDKIVVQKFFGGCREIRNWQKQDHTYCPLIKHLEFREKDIPWFKPWTQDLTFLDMCRKSLSESHSRLFDLVLKKILSSCCTSCDSLSSLKSDSWTIKLSPKKQLVIFVQNHDKFGFVKLGVPLSSQSHIKSFQMLHLSLRYWENQIQHTCWAHPA